MFSQLRKYIIWSFSALLFFLCSSWHHCAFAYTHNKTILLVNRDLQADSVGYNIVDELCRWAYVEILSDRLRLWETPEKKKWIKSAELVKTEMNMGCRFVKSTDIFVYETFKCNRRKIKFTTEGFSFTGKDASGAAINFGYVEVPERILRQMKNIYVVTNADGNYETSLHQALVNKNFIYDIVFFQDRVIAGMENSNAIKKELFNSKRKLGGYTTTTQEKYIQYNVEPGPSDKAANSGKLISSLQQFFNENPQEFYNNGGDRILDPMKKKPIIITSFKVLEVWKKTDKAIIHHPVKIIPYAFGSAIDTIPVSQFSKWRFKKDNTDLTSQLISKDFYYSLEKVNSTPVNPKSTQRWADALYKEDWSKLLEFLEAHPEKE